MGPRLVPKPKVAGFDPVVRSKRNPLETAWPRATQLVRAAVEYPFSVNAYKNKRQGGLTARPYSSIDEEMLSPVGIRREAPMPACCRPVIQDR